MLRQQKKRKKERTVLIRQLLPPPKLLNKFRAELEEEETQERASGAAKNEWELVPNSALLDSHFKNSNSTRLAKFRLKTIPNIYLLQALF